MSMGSGAGSGERRARRASLCLLGAALLSLAGCAVPIAAGLDESDANRVVVALEENGVAAQKEIDESTEGQWRVSVGRDDASTAIAVLLRESLPPPAAPGVLEAIGKGSLVPSRAAEHAKLIHGISGELERSLRALDGVLSARVHLAVASSDPLSGVEKPDPPTASVLMRHRGAAPPIATADVQRLVAGAVPGLDPSGVSVVATPVPAPARPAERELARFGPITVTRSSLAPFRLLGGGAVLLNVVLIGLILLLWTRVRKTQLLLGEARAGEGGESSGRR
jgi:type III secretion protein J